MQLCPGAHIAGVYLCWVRKRNSSVWWCGTAGRQLHASIRREFQNFLKRASSETVSREIGKLGIGLFILYSRNIVSLLHEMTAVIRLILAGCLGLSLFVSGSIAQDQVSQALRQTSATLVQGNAIIAKLDGEIEAARVEWQVPGLAVAIVKDNQVLLSKGYGVKRVNTADAVDADTLFAIASNSKAFTAAALAILVDEGKVGWMIRFKSTCLTSGLKTHWHQVTCACVISCAIAVDWEHSAVICCGGELRTHPKRFCNAPLTWNQPRPLELITVIRT